MKKKKSTRLLLIWRWVKSLNISLIRSWKVWIRDFLIPSLVWFSLFAVAVIGIGIGCLMDILMSANPAWVLIFSIVFLVLMLFF